MSRESTRAALSFLFFCIIVVQLIALWVTVSGRAFLMGLAICVCSFSCGVIGAQLIKEDQQ